MDHDPHPAVRLVAALAVVLLVAGVATYAVRTVRDAPPAHPDRWDPGVADIAAFVEQAKGGPFEHPVFVEFLSDDEFRDRVTTTQDDLDDEDRQQLDQAVAQLRALGLVEGEVDLFAQTNQLTGEGVAAFYSSETERVTVKGTELTPGLEATLAHELTHAWQDQRFDLRRLQRLEVDEDNTAVDMVIEGDASNVEDAYVDDELTDEERQAYDEESATETEEADLAEVPEILVALFAAPYAAGPLFVDLVDQQRPSRGVDDLFREPPDSDAFVFDARRYFDGAAEEEVDAISPPEGATTIDEGRFGGLAWFLVLSQRMDPREALAAIDEWAGDRYVTYEEAADGPESGRVCVDLRYRAADADGLAAVEPALRAWVDAGPAGSASVEPIDDRTVGLRSCDPGADASGSFEEASLTAIQYPVGRLTLAQTFLPQADDLDQAWCAADAVVRVIPPDQISSDSATPELERRIVTAATSCGLGPGG